MKSLANKFLIVKPNVVLTPHIDGVIAQLDAFFAAANLKAFVTSGLRDSDSQLRIIRNELTRRHIASDFQEAFQPLTDKIIWEGQEVYAWQPAWSKLLSLGYIVNPPLTAKVLMDYVRPGSSENRKGQLIGQSPHTRGTAFDIGGGVNGLTDEVIVLVNAKEKVNGMKDYLIERNNNAIHVDCRLVA
jgi:hypothetical protein